jgi:protein-L-isoaspartate(D-aspartate) O-methyltransferase
MAYSAIARTNMVEGQLRPNKVTDARLLGAMGQLPREQFAPDAARAIAYTDEAIDLGGCRSMMEPMVLGRLLQELQAQPHELALHVGCNTGYGTAVLARLCTTVVAVEEEPPLAYAAIANLQKVGADNAVVIANKLIEGYAKQAPYDVILVEGGTRLMPEKLLAQLAPGGRLVAVELGKGAMGQAKLWQRVGEGTSARVLFDANAALLPGFAPKVGFVF